MGLIIVSGLLLAYLQWLFLWKPMILDYYRDNIFILRRKLFILVLDGKISPSDNAYKMLWVIFNGAIRYSNRITLVDFIVFSVFYRKSESGTGILKQVRNAIAQVPENETRKELCTLLNSMHEETGRLLFYNNTVLLIVLVLALVVSFLFIKISSKLTKQFSVLGKCFDNIFASDEDRLFIKP